MRANTFIADLLWDVNNHPFSKGSEVAALFVDTYNIADSVPFTHPLQFSRFRRRESFSITVDGMCRQKTFANIIVVSGSGGRLLDMRDAIPPDQYRM